MFILNCGGTFNKLYNKLSGELEIPFHNDAIDRILQSCTNTYKLSGAVYKDSLDMDANDRKMIADIVLHSDYTKILIIHGTDTIDKTAEFLSHVVEDKLIVLTGAMKPFEIDNIEASLNIGMAMGFIQGNDGSGVHICMSGYVVPFDEIKKNKIIGKFELV